MEIIIFDGKENILIRGKERDYEVCFQRIRKGKKTWEPEKYFYDVASVFRELLNRKVRNSDARTLSELKESILKARSELTEVWS